MCTGPRGTPAVPPAAPRPVVLPPAAPDEEALTAPLPSPHPASHWAPAPAVVPRVRRGPGRLLLVVLLIGGTAVAAALVVPRLLDARADESPAATAGLGEAEPTAEEIEPEPTAEETGPEPSADSVATEDVTTPEPSPTAVGIVEIGPGVTDGRAGSLAGMFDAYFGGINDKDYDRVAAVLDPSGSVDPGDPADMAGLARGTRTTRDSEIVLLGVEDAGGGRLRADVTFRSDQEAGAGPRQRPGETCTRWRITYTVSGTAPGDYRIVRGKGTSAPC
ncbi:hypothetical protein [Pseudosporangium ferrugineum]|uniref:hypothetical protein n=1 Tax=Pseudosporangium ferrugineum TaxID=439699 RepID=UPI0011B258BA|nr:hypothetical protein [Pseudosporangium ferrugineum]